jgi:4-hydroxy-tetrahydrodipicolinate synthase
MSNIRDDLRESLAAALKAGDKMKVTVVRSILAAVQNIDKAAKKTIDDIQVVETIAKLASYPQVIGIKEASGDMNYMLDVINNTDDEFLVYNGNDNLIIPTSSMKINGVISAISNAMVVEISHLCNLLSNEEYDEALSYYLSIHSLVNECYKNVNPIGVKALFEIMHGMETSLRLPLVKADSWLYESLKKEVDVL